MTTPAQFPSFDMAAITAPSSFTAVDSRPLAEGKARAVRRRFTPQMGRALELLGHAIEYLADECVHQPDQFLDEYEPRLEAIQILMRANRNIFYSAPIVPSLGHRLRTLFGIG